MFLCEYLLNLELLMPLFVGVFLVYLIIYFAIKAQRGASICEDEEVSKDHTSSNYEESSIKDFDIQDDPTLP